MNKIKCARIYRIELPTELNARLAEVPARELLSLDVNGAGFVHIFDDYVATAGGFEAFRIKHQAKIIPGSVVREIAEESIREIEESEGRKVGRKEARDIKDSVLQGLLPRALIKTTYITAYYNRRQSLLFLPVAGKNLADTCMSALVKACGAVKATTIHFSNIKGGLTTRLPTRDFGEFTIGGMVKLESESGKRTFDLTDIDSADEGLGEALSQGAEVTEIELCGEGMTFRLTHDFVLKRIVFDERAEDDADEDEQWAWQQDVTLQVGLLTRTANDLCTMFDDLLA